MGRDSFVLNRHGAWDGLFVRSRRGAWDGLFVRSRHGAWGDSFVDALRSMGQRLLEGAAIRRNEKTRISERVFSFVRVAPTVEFIMHPVRAKKIDDLLVVLLNPENNLDTTFE